MKRFQQVLQHPRFRNEDLGKFNIDRVDAMLVDDNEEPNVIPNIQGQWNEVDVTIKAPVYDPDSGSSFTTVQVPGLRYRKLTTAIRSSLEDWSTMERMHLEPYRSYWTRPGTSQTERIFDEIYTSDAMLEAHETLQRQPQEPGCTLERVVLALLFASDATHPTNFGQAKLWPVYMAYGNISKYDRCRPELSLMQHIAYLPGVSAYF